ncbi:MAG: PAS domain S-box protein [Arcobacteraceae bacterium]|jgi:PAS domain S-box-containing protein|nr:PAS domain S-box protein [Arcobacteraceae bacterium]
MKFYKSLRFKLIAFSVLIEVVMLSLLIANSSRLIESHLVSQSIKQLSETKSNIKASLLPLVVARDYASLDSILNEFTHSNKIVYIFVKDDRQIIASSKWDTSQEVPNISEEFNTDFDVFHTKISIDYLGQTYAEAYFGIDTMFLKNAQNELVSQSFIIAFVEIVLTTVLLFSIGYLLTKNLFLLNEAAENITKKNFDVKLDIEGDDEIGRLSKTFNTMIVQIKSQLSTIEQQNKFQHSLINNIAYSMIATDRQGIITSFNNKSEEMLGYKASEVVGICTPEIFHDKEEVIKRSEEFSNELGETVNSGFEVFVIKTDRNLPNEHIWNYISKDGKIIQVKLCVTALKDSDGEILGYIGLAEDITEKLILEHSLFEETHRVKAILENAGDYIHILDMEGNVFMFSDSFADSLGYTKEETAKLNVTAWDIGFDTKTISELVINPKSFETKHTKKDGTVFDVEVRTSGIELDGKMYLYAASRDITERKIAQEQLHQRDILLQQQTRLAAIGEMMANIAHQWRQPLSAITSSISGLKLKQEYGLLEDKDISEVNDHILKNADFLSKTIDNFRNFFKKDQIKRKFFIADSINETVNIIKASYDNHFIQLDKDVDESIYYFGSDNMLSQVVLNLLSNSKDALVHNNIYDKHVMISLSIKNNNIRIEVKDNGGGIKEEIQEKIFDPYFTTKHQHQGTGLGLYMSNQIIQNHFNGQITVQNITTEFGMGACFVIEFPSIEHSEDYLL